MEIFNRLESNVRSYCRSFPTLFTSAEGAILRDDTGREYIDFFSGAGTLNYGHNHPQLREQLIEYLMSNGVVHSLDMSTAAKEAFLETFEGKRVTPSRVRL